MTALALELDIDPAQLALRCAVYGRQSHDSTASIGQQLDLGRDRAKHQGWPVAGEFKDGRSASRHARRDRDDWPRLVGQVLAGAIDVIWLWESSRGDRKLSTWAALLEACQERGVYIWVETHKKLYDMRNSRDMRTMGEEGTDNVYESDKIADRVNRDKEAARAAGILRTVLGGNPPVGFRQGKHDWETDPAHADVMRDVAARMFEGEDLRSAFRDQPPLTDAIGRPVNEKMMRAALRRPASAGLMTRRGEVIGKAAITNPPLDELTWRRLQMIFDANRAGRKPKMDSFPFGKILACGKCGNQLTGGSIYYRYKGRLVRETPSYMCKTPHKGHEHPCRGVSASAAEIHELIRQTVEVFAAASPSYLAATSQQESAGAREAELAERIEQAQTWVADLGIKRFRGLITPEREAEGVAEAEAMIGGLRDELAAVTASAADPVLAGVDWDERTPAGRLALARMVLQTPIVVEPGRGGARPQPIEERVQILPAGQPG